VDRTRAKVGKGSQMARRKPGGRRRGGEIGEGSAKNGRILLPFKRGQKKGKNGTDFGTGEVKGREGKILSVKEVWREKKKKKRIRTF